MKKAIIGGILMFCGVLTTLSIIITATIYVPNITAWSGSKLWFAIFGAKQYGNEVVQSLFLGFPFVVGIIFTVVGLCILFMEYFSREQ